MITGSLISNGGISINCTYESTSSSSGGALTVGGGISTIKNLYIGQDLILDNLTSKVIVKGVSENRLFLDNQTNKQFYISLDGVYKTLELNEDGLYINNNIPSENASTGALRVLGGVTINTNEESSSITSGSGLTVFGGAGIVKKLYVGGGIESIDSTNTIGNIYTITTGNVGIGTTSPQNLLDLRPGNNSGNISIDPGTIENGFMQVCFNGNFDSVDTRLVDEKTRYRMYCDIRNTTDIFIFDTLTSSGSINNVMSITPDGNIGIGTLNPSATLDVTGDARFTTSITTPSVYTTDIDATNISTGILQLSDKLFSSNISIANTVNNYTVSSGSINASGDVVMSGTQIMFTASGVDEPSVNGRSNGTKLVLYPATNETTGDYAIGIENRNMWLQVATESDGFKFYQGTTATLVLSTGGNVGMGTTNPSVTLDIIGSVKISENITTESIAIIENLIALGNSNTLGSIITTGGNVGIGTSDLTHKLTINGDTIVSGDITFGSFHIVSNKIGINNTNPSSNFDINTDTRITNILTIENLIPSDSFTTGTLIIQNGGIGINCTNEATSYTSGGAMSIAGGISINKNMFVKEDVNINGIVKIENNTDSTDTSSGSLQIFGGIGVLKNVNVGEKTTTDKLVITNVQASLNATSGSIISAGGITIQTNENATSSTAGGGLTITGGIGIGKDIYIDGNGYQKGFTNYYSEANSFIQIYNASNEKIYSLDRNYFNNEFSISRYNAGSLIEKTFELSHTTGEFKFNNLTKSTGQTSASVIISGGLSINSTENSENSSVGGSLSVYGGQSISKDLNIGGSIFIHSTQQSIDVSTGSLIVKGGVGIWKNVNIHGNTSINGDLYVNGTTTSLNSSNTVLTDNILVLNAAPSGIKDSGIIITRFQQDNDTGFGDVVNENAYIDFQIPNQVGMTTEQIKLSSLASSENDYYKDWWLKVTSGFSSNQVRKITGYDGITKIATISSPWTSQNPAESDLVFLYNRSYIGLIYNETDDIFVFGSTLNDPGNTSVTLTDNIRVKMSDLVVSGTSVSSNSTTGSIIVYGGVSINCTENATSNTVGGSLTINGGASVKKTLYVGEELYINNANLTPNPGDKWKSTIFSATNNQIVPQVITNLEFEASAWGFDVFLTARLTGDSDLYANYHLRGVNKVNSWEIVKTYVGDDMGLEFFITNDGEIQYTSPDYGAGFVSLEFKWRVFAN
jgi:hypothetical protein